MNNLPSAIPLLLLLVLVGCAEALPQRDPEAVIEHTARKVDTLSSRSKQYAEDVKQERLKSEALLQEARDILAQVRASENLCRAALAEAKRPKKPRVVYIKDAPKVAAPVATQTPQTPPSAADTPSAPGEPEYSPSDAPVSKSALPAAAPSPAVSPPKSAHDHH